MKVIRKRVYNAEQWFANKTMPVPFGGVVCEACNACPAPHVHMWDDRNLGAVECVSDGYWLVHMENGEFEVHDTEEFARLFAEVPPEPVFVIKWVCQDCGKELSFKTEDIGREIICPECGDHSTIGSA